MCPERTELQQRARRESNPRPSDSKWFQEASTGVFNSSQALTNDSNTSGFQDVTDSSHSSSSQPLATETKNFAALVLHDSNGRAVPGFEPLLTVKEVAAILRVCRDTVYRLCATGKLPHFRILNAIRVTPGDLEAFILATRQPDIWHVALPGPKD